MQRLSSTVARFVEARPTLSVLFMELLSYNQRGTRSQEAANFAPNFLLSAPLLRRDLEAVK
jgi:hypothetical protein